MAARLRRSPTTQRGVFRDEQGRPVDMGKHGTSTGTETST
ncbi:putative ATP-grasp-modified RiPP, partial [Streptomyces pharetrae]